MDNKMRVTGSNKPNNTHEKTSKWCCPVGNRDPLLNDCVSITAEHSSPPGFPSLNVCGNANHSLGSVKNVDQLDARNTSCNVLIYPSSWNSPSNVGKNWNIHNNLIGSGSVIELVEEKVYPYPFVYPFVGYHQCKLQPEGWSEFPNFVTTSEGSLISAKAINDVLQSPFESYDQLLPRKPLMVWTTYEFEYLKEIIRAFPTLYSEVVKLKLNFVDNVDSEYTKRKYAELELIYQESMRKQAAEAQKSNPWTPWGSEKAVDNDTDDTENQQFRRPEVVAVGHRDLLSFQTSKEFQFSQQKNHNSLSSLPQIQIQHSDSIIGHISNSSYPNSTIPFHHLSNHPPPILKCRNTSLKSNCITFTIEVPTTTPPIIHSCPVHTCNWQQSRSREHFKCRSIIKNPNHRSPHQINRVATLYQCISSTRENSPSSSEESHSPMRNRRKNVKIRQKQKHLVKNTSNEGSVAKESFQPRASCSYDDRIAPSTIEGQGASGTGGGFQETIATFILSYLSNFRSTRSRWIALSVLIMILGILLINLLLFIIIFCLVL